MTAQTRKLKVDQRFELELVLDGTQDFRWRSWKDGWLSGVLAGHLVHVRQVGDILEYRASEEANLDDLLRSYFRLDEDVETVHKELSGADDTMAKLVNRYPYLRILRQPDPWQATVSYICSPTNRIERISKSVENIACSLGEPKELHGDVRHTFPEPEKVRGASENGLKGLTVGLPSFPTRIVKAAERIRARSLNLNHLSQPDVCYAEAKRRLMGCQGIGGKVADCIALFSLDKTQAFPVDTWVERALNCYYPEQKNLSGDVLVMWAQDRFGEHAGYASQLLFLAQREHENVAATQLAESEPCSASDVSSP